MDLYIIEKGGRAPRFEGTQATAKHMAREMGGKWTAIKVPDRKEDQIAWLNGFAGGLYRDANIAASRIEIDRKPVEPRPIYQHEHDTGALSIRPDCLPREAMGRSMSAGAILARSDNPNIDVDGIVETIINSKAHALRRFAAAVAIAFSKLAGE